MFKEIILEGNNIERVRKLLSFVPDNFGNVPLKFSNINNTTYASIQSLTPTVSMCFSSIIQLDKITELNDDMYVRVPINKIIMNQILGGTFEKVQISENKIIAENEKKSVDVSLLLLNESDKIELPYTNTELYDSVMEKNPHLKGDNILFDMDNNDIKEIIDCWSVLRTSEKDNLLIRVKSNNKGINISCKDTLDNSFKYNIKNSDATNKIVNNVFDKTLIEVFEKLNRVKDNNIISMLVSSPLIAFSIINDELNCVLSIGIPGKE